MRGVMMRKRKRNTCFFAKGVGGIRVAECIVLVRPAAFASIAQISFAIRANQRRNRCALVSRQWYTTQENGHGVKGGYLLRCHWNHFRDHFDRGLEEAFWSRSRP